MIDWKTGRWIYSSDLIYMGDKRVKEIWMGNKKIYPEDVNLDFLYCHGSSVVVFNNEIHILGGAKYIVDGVEVLGYSRQHVKWSNGKWVKDIKTPISVGSKSAVVYNNEIHIISDDKHYKFDGRSWIYVCDLPDELKYWICFIVFNNHLHVYTEAYDYVFNGSSWVGTRFRYGGRTFFEGKCVVYNNMMYCFNRRGWGSSTDCYVYDGNTEGTYDLVKDLPFAHNFYGVNNPYVVYGNEIHAIPIGSRASSRNFNEHYKFDGTNSTLLSNYIRNIDSSGHGPVVVYNNKIHFFTCNDTTTGPYYCYHSTWDGNSYETIENWYVKDIPPYD